jgi:hypothetical protein
LTHLSIFIYYFEFFVVVAVLDCFGIFGNF